MVIRRVEQVYKSVWNMLPPQTKRQIVNGLRNGDPKVIKEVSSIFKIPYVEAKKFLMTSGIVGLGLSANAATSNVNSDANTIKQLTPEERAKLQSKGRADLIAASENPEVAKRQYYKKVGAKDPTSELDYPDVGATVDETADFVMNLAMLGRTPIAKSAATSIANKYIQIINSKGAKAAKAYVLDAIARARTAAVKANPKAAQSIKEGTTKLTGSIDGYFKNVGEAGMASAKEINNLFNFEYSTATQKEINSIFNSAKDGVITKAEEETLTKLIKENASGLQALAKELNVTSKKDLPVLLKFVKDTYNILSNAPGYVKAIATGATIAGGLGGLTLFDMYQSYRENGDTYSGLKTPVGKIIRNVLGYDGKDKLSKAAARKAGLTPDMTEKQAADAEQGIFSQDLIDSDVDEYFTGMSGRKYHNLNGYIYDFATGRPVNIADAINDYSQKLEYDDQQLVSKINSANQQLADLQQLKNSGYAISDDQLIQAQNNVDLLQNQRSNNITKLEAITAPEFDTTKDLIEQYKSNVVQPQQQVQQAQQAEYQRTFDDVYKAAFERIAQDTYNDLDNYYGPQQQQVDYYAYKQRYYRGEAPYLSPDDFVKYQKMEYMKQMSPKIQQSALQYAQLASNQMYQQGNIYNKQRELDNLQKQRSFENWLNINKFDAEQKKNLQEMYMKYLNYQNEVDRTNIQRENVNINKQKADIAAQGNVLKQQEIDIKKQMQPYQQMQYMGSSLEGAAMGGLTPDQFINANPEVAKQVFPSAFQEGNQQQQAQPQKQNFVMSIFNQLRGQ